MFGNLRSYLESAVKEKTGMSKVAIGMGQTHEAAYQNAVNDLPKKSLDGLKHKVVSDEKDGQHIVAIAYDKAERSRRSVGMGADSFEMGRSSQRYLP